MDWPPDAEPASPAITLTATAAPTSGSPGRLVMNCTASWKPAVSFAGLVTDPVQGLGIPFMLAGPILCALCIVTYVVVSLTSAPPSPGQLEIACWGSPLKAVTETRITGLTDPRVVALLLFALLCVLYLFLH